MPDLSGDCVVGWRAPAVSLSRYPGVMATITHGRGAGEASLRALVEQHRDAIKALAARHNGGRVRLFGSVARGEEDKDSDIDLLVDFLPGSSLFDLLRLTRELEALLRRPVDVVSRGGLKPRDRGILEEAIDL
jgi:predicted nucleotidyltransferase